VFAYDQYLYLQDQARILLDPEDEDITVLRNVGVYQSTRLKPHHRFALICTKNEILTSGDCPNPEIMFGHEEKAACVLEVELGYQRIISILK
jgi:hypothetical protein